MIEKIHQNLGTRTKLFCSCKPQLFKGEPEITFLRGLRPTQSELGQVDPAAFFEFQKGVKILYESNKENACLVEMDEEPPHGLNREALEIAIVIALMMEAKPVDEVHIMRKTVIDGSNTTGFQRTCVIALNGEVDVEGKKIPIQHISLEEDAARKTGEDGSIIRYRIDRLGIPLVEVATAPVLYSPKEVEKAALAVGRILRATGKVKRGLGTIRQDLNVSIRDGALNEIKGVQELGLVSKVVEYEVQRQLNLLKIQGELKKRLVTEKDIEDDFIDISSILKETECQVIRMALSQNIHGLAVVLPKFAGLLRMELAPGMSLGTEMSDLACYWGRVGGIYHTDEMPAYGITIKESTQLRQFIKTQPMDVVVFVVDTLEKAIDALKTVTKRAREAVIGIPSETRAANPDGTTRYTRPRPGAARMYPETDVPPIKLTQEYLEKLSYSLPELPDQKKRRLINQYKLNQKLARQIIDSKRADVFEIISKKTKVSPIVIAATLTETLKALKRDGIEIQKVSDEKIIELFCLIDSGKTVKEAIPEIITWLAKRDDALIKEAIEELGLEMIPQKELEQMVDHLIEENRVLIKERGSRAFGFLMGAVMKRVRGKVKAKLVSNTIQRKLKKLFEVEDGKTPSTN